MDLEGNKCVKKIDATSKTTYKYACPEGFNPSGEGEQMVCSKTVKREGIY